MPEFQYKFEGDGPKVFQGRIIQPGDVIEADEQLIHGHFTPLSPAAKAAHAEYEAKYLAPAAQAVPAAPSFAEQVNAPPTAPAEAPGSVAVPADIEGEGE